MAITQIINTVTASAGGYIAMTSGYMPVFYICAIGDLIGLLLLMLYLDESRKAPSVIEHPTGGLSTKLRGFFMPEPGIARLYFILLVMGLGYSTGYSLFYGTLVDNYGFTELQLGLLSTAFSLSWSISSIPIGRLSDRFGRKPMLIASTAVAVTTVVGFIAFRSFEAFLLFEVVSALDPALHRHGEERRLFKAR
jgi:predicted MFS family arabinose efflux permease